MKRPSRASSANRRPCPGREIVRPGRYEHQGQNSVLTPALQWAKVRPVLTVKRTCAGGREVVCVAANCCGDSLRVSILGGVRNEDRNWSCPDRGFRSVGD